MGRRRHSSPCLRIALLEIAARCKNNGCQLLNTASVDEQFIYDLLCPPRRVMLRLQFCSRSTIVHLQALLTVIRVRGRYIVVLGQSLTDSAILGSPKQRCKATSLLLQISDHGPTTKISMMLSTVATQSKKFRIVYTIDCRLWKVYKATPLKHRV